MEERDWQCELRSPLSKARWPRFLRWKKRGAKRGYREVKIRDFGQLGNFTGDYWMVSSVGWYLLCFGSIGFSWAEIEQESRDLAQCMGARLKFDLSLLSKCSGKSFVQHGKSEFMPYWGEATRVMVTVIMLQPQVFTFNWIRHTCSRWLSFCKKKKSKII